MPDEQTATLSPDAAPSDPPPGPVDEKLSLPPDGGAPAPDAAPEAGGPEGSDDGETPPIPWAETPTADELFEHEAVKPLVEERMTAAREEARDAALDEASNMGDFLQRQEETLKSATGRINAFANEFDDLAEAGGLDEKKLGRLIEQHGLEQHLLAVRGAQQRVGDFNGVTRVLTALLSESGAEDALTKRLLKRVERIYSNQGDEALPADVVKAITKAAVAPVREELDKANATITRLTAEAGNAQRQGKQPVPNVSGGGGGGKGRSDSDVLKDPHATAEQKKEAYRRKHGADIDSLVPTA